MSERIARELLKVAEELTAVDADYARQAMVTLLEKAKAKMLKAESAAEDVDGLLDAATKLGFRGIQNEISKELYRPFEKTVKEITKTRKQLERKISELSKMEL